MTDSPGFRIGLTSYAVSGSATVLEVTGDSVRVVSGAGSPDCGDPPQTLVDAAFGWIDDPVGLLDERPVSVADMWRSLMMALVGERRDTVVVLHPPDWPRHRVDRVVAAANTVADHVEAVSRDRWSQRVGDEPADGGRIEQGRPLLSWRLPSNTLLVVGAVVALAGAGLALRAGLAPKAASGMTVVEGRMTVEVPAHWIVERVTAGPGSRRLQVSPPQDREIAVHLTSSYAPETTLEQSADILRHAIAAEPPGVFVDVRTPVEVAGRPSATYREVRPGRVIVWSVVIAGATRISIGCQSPPGREVAVRAACDEAVRSARET